MTTRIMVGPKPRKRRLDAGGVGRKRVPANRVFHKDTDTLTFDNGKADYETWVKFSRIDGRLAVDRCGAITLTPKSIRILSAWLAETHVQHQ